MRSIRGLVPEVSHDNDYSKFPQGNIKNDTDSEAGTPVVREIYGDLLTNIYAILEDAGVEINQQEDNEVVGYQLLEAFKKFTNELNDIEHILTLTETVWSININIDNLPDKYVMIVRASEDYDMSQNYTFSGEGDNIYPFISSGNFNSGDNIILIIDEQGVRAIPLAGITSNNDEVFTVFGVPVNFNDGGELYYEENGSLLTDRPSVNHLQQIIRVAESNGTLLVYNIFILKGYALCYCYLPDVQTYKFYQFSLSDLSTAVLVNITGLNIPVAENREPYAYGYVDGVILTNSGGTTDNDFDISTLIYDPLNQSLVLSQSNTLNSAFRKTTNAVINGVDLISYVDGDLKKYNLTNNSEQILGTFNGRLGLLFSLNGIVYFTNGDVARKWLV